MKMFFSLVIFIFLESYVLMLQHACHVHMKSILILEHVSDVSRKNMLSIMTGQYNAWKGLGYLILFLFLCIIAIELLKLLNKKNLKARKKNTRAF